MLVIFIIINTPLCLFTAHDTSSIEEQVKASIQVVTPSSTYADSPTGNKQYTLFCNQVMAFTGVTILSHRAGLYGPHVSLYYPQFDSFTKNCEDVVPDSDDCLTAAKLCTEMSKYFNTEDSRIKSLQSILTPYLCEVDLRQYWKIGTGRCDLAGLYGAYILFITEGKGEVGQGAVDSLAELAGYYLGSADSRNYTVCPAPCFLMELVGTHLFISGAVLGKHVCIDRLAPVLWLVPQYESMASMLQTAKVLRALKDALSQLSRYYDQILQSQILQSRPLQPRYPCFNTFSSEGITYTLNYTAQVKQNLFEGQLGDGKVCHPVMIKFPQAYSTKVHSFLAEQGCAPTLYWSEKISDLRHVVVMQKILGERIDTFLEKNENDEIARNVLQKLETAITSPRYMKLAYAMVTCGHRTFWLRRVGVRFA